MPIDPSNFSQNEAWLVLQLNEVPVQTEADGEFNAMAILEVSTGVILGTDLIPVAMTGPPEFLARKLLASAEDKAGSKPQTLFVATEDEADELVKVATAMKIEVVRVPHNDLASITDEARAGFSAHVTGGRVQ